MSVGELIHCIIIIAACAIAYSVFAYESRVRIVPAPSMPAVRRAVITLMQQHKNVTDALTIIDIGSGWGGFLYLLAKAFPKSHIIGYELSPAPYFASRIFTAFAKRITIHRKDFFAENLNDADIVIGYLSHWHMKQIEDGRIKFKPGSLFISCSFPLPTRAADETITVKSIIDIPVYLYKN